MNSSRAERLAAAGGRGAGAAVFFVLAVLLILAVHRGHREAVREARTVEAVSREADRVKLENESLRREIRALESDPIYVESVLRGRSLKETGEKTTGK